MKRSLLFVLPLPLLLIGLVLFLKPWNQAPASAEEMPLELLPPEGVMKIIVSKGKRRLDLYEGNRKLRSYRIALGKRPVGDKVKKGDRKTPEGTFRIRIRNPKSAYYLSLGLDYPQIEDAKRGLRDKLITRATHDRIIAAINNGKTPPQNTALGGDIYIHGNGSSRDWTWGCVALDDTDMKELYDVVPLGTEVVIRP